LNGRAGGTGDRRGGSSYRRYGPSGVRIFPQSQRDFAAAEGWAASCPATRAAETSKVEIRVKIFINISMAKPAPFV